MLIAEVSIRPIQKADCAEVARIYNQYVGIANMDTLPKMGKYYERMLQDFSEKEGIWVLQNKGEILGWGVIKKYSDRLGYQTTCETSVYIDKPFLGGGLGTHLKKYLIEICRKLGYVHLVAKIQADNPVSIAYNKKLGYEMVGTQRKAGMLNGEWKDVVIMQLLLD